MGGKVWVPDDGKGERAGRRTVVPGSQAEVHVPFSVKDFGLDRQLPAELELGAESGRHGSVYREGCS